MFYLNFIARDALLMVSRKTTHNVTADEMRVVRQALEKGNG